MARWRRGRRQNLFEDMFELTAKLPWWVGVVLALGFYFGLHHVAVTEIVAPTGTKDMAAVAGKQLFKTLAMFGQYVLPAAFLFGALGSVLSRNKRDAPPKAADTVAPSPNDVPVCPQCGAAMVLRTAREGTNAGSSFWGCPQYPKCRGTRPA